MDLRICYIPIKGYMDYQSESHNMKVAEEVRSIIEAKNFNVTWIRYTDVGLPLQPGSLEHGGCIGSVQRNESDTALIMPVNAYFGSSVTLVNTITSTKIAITSVYERVSPESRGSATRVLDFLESF